MGEQHYKRASEKIPVYLQFFERIFIMKVVENSLKTYEIASLLKNFLGEHAPKPHSNEPPEGLPLSLKFFLLAPIDTYM